MRVVWIITVFMFAAAEVFAAEAGPPKWAYPTVPPPPAAIHGTPTPPPDPTPRRVPKSEVTFTISQIRDLYNVPDWHPGNHPPAPEVVMRGRQPGVLACGYCHLPNGQGRPENAGVAGLPAEYIIQQVAEFKNGTRRSAEPAMTPPNMMIGVAKLASDEEVRAAAVYFASLKFKPWIRVVEARMVPKTRVAGAMYVPVEGGDVEPIGLRIVELPEDVPRTELRDSESGFVAYVPPGSIKKGEAIALRGGRKKVTPCVACHGPNLRGLGPVPPLAGRSPSYLMRQLYDLKHGARAGAWSPLMKSVVDRLDEADMLAVVAYASSRRP
jgi:cytochrome c553